MTNYNNLKRGDIVTPEYITSNQRHITYDKEYEVLDVRHYEINRHVIKIQNDEGKKVWFNDFQSLSNFKLVIPLSKDTLTGNSNVEIQNANSPMILLNNILVNINHIVTAQRFYTMLKEPRLPEREEKPRLYITFINSKTESIYFDTKEDLEQAFNKLK